MVHAKSNWLNDLTKICSWYMDDGALLVWLVRGDSHSAIPDSMQHVRSPSMLCHSSRTCVPLYFTEQI